MAINIDERFISREQTDGEQRSAEVIYLAECTDGENELEAKYAVLAYCPAVYDAMVPVASHVEAINATMYEVAITYGPPKRAEPNTPTWSFDTTGGTRKVTQAVAHLGDYAAPGQAAPNFGGAIGVTPDGNVEGVEVPAPSGKYSEHWKPHPLVCLPGCPRFLKRRPLYGLPQTGRSRGVQRNGLCP
ncbi:MAG: hypothetical protein NTW96_16535 [Planctomycetia bacterium]|nr:hypothetical protein [Planctomycetia bacterium]